MNIYLVDFPMKNVMICPVRYVNVYQAGYIQSPISSGKLQTNPQTWPEMGWWSSKQQIYAYPAW